MLRTKSEPTKKENSKLHLGRGCPNLSDKQIQQPLEPIHLEIIQWFRDHLATYAQCLDSRIVADMEKVFEFMVQEGGGTFKDFTAVKCNEVFEGIFTVGLKWTMPIKTRGLFTKSNQKMYKSQIKMGALNLAAKTIRRASDYIAKAEWPPEHIREIAQNAASWAEILVSQLRVYEIVWNHVGVNESMAIKKFADVLGNENKAEKLLHKLYKFLTDRNAQLNPKASSWEGRANLDLTRSKMAD